MALKTGIWVYFILLIFEGALRKWGLPSLASPLLVVRDPVAVFIIGGSIVQGIFRFDLYISCMLGIATAALAATMFVGHSNAPVAVYGFRILALQFPLIFVIGKLFDHDDVIKMGKALLWIVLPMTVLITLQFYSPQDAWVNRGVGGDVEGAGFTGAMGYLRPPGTFSFTLGLSLFYSLAVAFILYFWLDKTAQINRWLLFIATGCLIVSIPLSLSRALLFSVFISFAFALVLASYRPKYLFRLTVSTLGAGLLLLTLSNFSFFSTGVEAFISRFEFANATEGGAQGIFFDRFLGGMIDAVANSGNIPFFGFGMGLGTTAGAKIMTGEASFLISEGEWGRLIGEMGLFLGMAVILIRFSVVVQMFINSVRSLQKRTFLPWMLFSFSALPIIQGQWGQPSALGFAVLSGGLILASFKKVPVTGSDRSREYKQVPFEPKYSLGFRHVSR